MALVSIMADAAQPSLSRFFARALPAALVIVAIVTFLQSLGFGYVFDDTYAIRDNPALRGWSSVGRVWQEQFGGEGGPFFGLYRPLTMTLFAIVYNAGAKWPLWFHLVALLLHATATLLVWRLLRQAMALWAAFFAALWFAVHPVHVEAVANVTNSSEVLAAVWTLLLAGYVVVRARRETTLGWLTASGAGALYLAAMLSKESGAMAAPITLLVAWGWHRDAFPDARSLIARGWRLGIAFTAAVALVAIARAIVLGGPVTGQPIAALGIAGMSAGTRVAAMLSLIPSIVRLLLWPAGVNPHYGPSTFPEQRALFAIVGLVIVAAVVGAGVLFARRGDRRVFASIGLTILAFLPASNILVPTGQVLAERTLYLPSVGVVMLLGVVLDRIGRMSVDGRWMRLSAAALILAILWSGSRSARWTEHWRNHDRLFARMIAADPKGYAGYWLSGVEATRQGRAPEGRRLLEQAYAMEQRDRGVVLDFGASLTNNGELDRAARVYREALKLAPTDSLLNARLRALPAR